MCKTGEPFSTTTKAIMPATRLYEVTSFITGIPRLIDAKSPAQAIAHVARTTFDVCPATSKSVAALVSRGVRVETAGAEPESQPPADNAHVAPGCERFGG